VATTLAITVEDAAAATVARRTGAGVEHLESYGVAVACSALGIPFIAVLGVANTVGSQGRAQWRANHESASVAAGEHLLGWLRQGAPGLPL
jgi:nucleoside phosphorylase